MKHLLLLSLAAACTLPAGARIARWTVPPVYDSITVMVPNKVLATDSAGTTTLWTPDGRQLYKTDNKIMPYAEGVALVKDSGGRMVAIVDEKGGVVQLPGLKTVYGNDTFHDGHFIFNEGTYISYIRPNGEETSYAPAVRTYPFNHGLAPYLTFDDFEGLNGPYYGYYRADGEPMFYTLYEDNRISQIDPRDIQFLSGISPDGRGVAVIGNKLYWYSAADEQFEPLLWGDELSWKKRQLRLDGNYKEYFTNLPDKVEIRAKFGNKKTATLEFDRELVPQLFTFEGETIKFEKPAGKDVKYESKLGVDGKDGSFGLTYAAEPALPAQFDEVALMYGSRAFVKKDGRWGVIEIVPDDELQFRIRINNDEEIAFRHKKVESEIRLELPEGISAENARISIPPESGIDLDKASRKAVNSEDGNYVTYKCDITIPNNLPDTLTEVEYAPVTLTVNGITMYNAPIRANAWYLKHYNVQPVTQDIVSDSYGTTFTFNVSSQAAQEERDYPFTVRFESGGVQLYCDKVSETQYKVTVPQLADGSNMLNVYVAESGCPASAFPFEINLSRSQDGSKELVSINRRSVPLPMVVPGAERPTPADTAVADVSANK